LVFVFFGEQIAFVRNAHVDAAVDSHFAHTDSASFIAEVTQGGERHSVFVCQISAFTASPVEAFQTGARVFKVVDVADFEVSLARNVHVVVEMLVEVAAFDPAEHGNQFVFGVLDAESFMFVCQYLTVISTPGQVFCFE